MHYKPISFTKEGKKHGNEKKEATKVEGEATDLVPSSIVAWEG